MGVYVNPGNAGFARIAGSRYVDKTGLISLMNERIGGNCLVCISRPRRFGKSYAAKMLTAYYDCGCDSHALFDDKEIAGNDGYERHLNQYNVICLDITGFTSSVRMRNGSLRMVPEMIEKALRKDLIEAGFLPGQDESLDGFLLRCVESDGGKPFIFIIDEWDAVIREAKDDPVAQEAYLNLLRGWFNHDGFPSKAVAAVYMTGILPIKKDKAQPAISGFETSTAIEPRMFGPYFGFTESEVRRLCNAYHVSFEIMQRWYDGYTAKDVGPVYNPYAVMNALKYNDFSAYWTETSSAETLLYYISRDYSGLAKTIAELIGGVEDKVNTTGFVNDLTTFKEKDDVLTLLIHLGYLAYDADRGTVRIPNEEIARAFHWAIHEVGHEATLKRLEESERLFADTIYRREEAVVAQIAKIHMEDAAPLHGNREDSLRSVIKLAYYSYRDHYLQFEELPAGEGYADVVYLPRTDSNWPALVIELKWNKTAEGAIDQILRKKYPVCLENLGCPILLVGITYDRDAKDGQKKHTCRITEYTIK